MAANRIVLVVDFQSQNASNSINTLNQQIGSIGTTAVQSSNQASQGIKGFTLSIDQASKSINTLVASLTGLGLAALTREWLMMADSMQAAKFALTSAFGPEAASMIQSQMRSLAHEAGLSQIELLKNAQTLGAVFRVPAEQIPGLMNVLVNFTRHMGKGQEELNTLVQIVGQSMAKQFVTFRELANKFEAAGVDAVGIFMRITGKSRLELQKVLKGNEQDIKASLTQLLNAMQAQSAGAGAAFVKSVASAQMAQALDQLRDIGIKAFVALQPEISKAIELLGKFVAMIIAMTEAFNKADEPTKNFIKNMAALVATLLLLPAAIKIVTSLWATLVGIFTTVWNVIKFGVTTVRLLIAAFEALGTMAAAVAAFVGLPVEAVVLLTAAILTLIVLIAKLTLWPQALKLIGDAWNYIKEKASGAADAIKKSYENVKQFLGLGGTGTGIGENVEEHKKALEESQQALLQAQQKNLKAGMEGILALSEQYKEYIIKAKGYEDALANYRKAIAKDVDTEIKKREEEQKKTALKTAEELTRLRRQVTIAAAEVVPDSTFAGQARVAAVKAQARRDELEEDRRLQIQRVNDQVDKEVEGARITGALIGQSQATINANVNRLYSIAQQEKVGIAAKANEAIAEHDLQTMRDLNRLMLEEQQQYREQRLADELDMIQKQSQLTIMYMRADLKQTLQEKVQQIRDIEDEQEQAIALQRRQQLQAAQEAFDAYEQAHRGFAAGVEEEQRKLSRTQVQIEREAAYQIQADRLEAWRSTNEVIIEEQRKVYEGMKSTVEKVFDALTGKGKSMWDAISNAAKTALLGAIREQISSHVAAGLTQNITGRAVTFPGGVRRFFGNAPEFQGAGPRPELQPLGTTIESSFKPLNLAGTDLSTAAGLLVNSAGALTAAAGALVSTAGVGGGIANAGAVQSAAQTVQSAQSQLQLGAASMSSPAISGAIATTGTVSPSGLLGGMPGYSMPEPPIPGAYQPPSLASVPGLTSAGAVLSGPDPPAVQRANFLKSFNIGLPVKTGAGTMVPWASASPVQKLGSILTSQGAAQVGLSLGSALALSGFGRNTPGGRVQTIAGTTLAGLSAARMFPDLFNVGDWGPGATAAGGAALGLGVGVAAAGLQRGGVLGLGMSVGGGALAGAALGTFVLPGLGTAAGAIIGATVGAVGGILRLMNPTMEQQIRSTIHRVYGVDIANAAIRKQIVDIINQKYGGSLSVGVYSEDVQNIVRLYALSTGQSQGGLPRPMYPATFAQSQAGGLQLQPVYSGGQLINNPYVGSTTTQWQNYLTANPAAMYLQLNPQQAANLFAGQVVRVMNDNPGSVAAANTTSARNGTSRTTQATSLMEPLTVTR